MITVEVRLSDALRQQLNLPGSDPLRVVIDAGATLPALYQALDLRPEQVAFCTVNNRYPAEDCQLRDGDRLRLVAYAAGG